MEQIFEYFVYCYLNKKENISLRRFLLYAKKAFRISTVSSCLNGRGHLTEASVK